MSDIRVHLSMPAVIEQGLASGRMERVGGVIRYADSKQIVAWLRESSKAVSVADDLLFSRVLLSTGTTATTAMTLAGLVLPVVNIALAGYALLEIARHIREQHERMAAIHQQIAAEFNRDRQVEMLSALDSAQNILTAERDDYKTSAAGYVTDRLIASRSQLFIDIDGLFNAQMTPEQAQQLVNYHILAMQVTVMVVRCWLEIGELELACEWLRNSLRGHQQRVYAFVREHVLGEYPALYFHESVSDENFERYLNIERWLRGRRDVLSAVVKENRKDFWKDEAISPLFNSVLVVRTGLQEVPYYHHALPQAEVLIENYQRLAGFKLELESMAMPFAEWEALHAAEQEAHLGYLMLVATDLLAE